MLGAEEPSRVRGGALFGGAGGPLENYLGEITKHVIRKAPCRVILTAPPADWRARPEPKVGAPPADEEPALAPTSSADELDAEAEETLAQLEDRSRPNG